MTTGDETIVAYPCAHDGAYGVLHLPENCRPQGVVVFDRVGIHRQSVLWAREWSRHGVAVFRVDVRGSGDNEGELNDIEDAHVDVESAINAFQAHAPEVKGVILWGISQGASISCLYAPHDPRVSGMVLCNPWVRITEKEIARHLLGMRLARIADPAFWAKIRNSEDGLRGAFRSFLNLARESFQRHPPASSLRPTAARGVYELDSWSNPRPISDRLMESMQQFQGDTLLILSEDDPAAKAFEDCLENSREWPALQRSGKVTAHRMAEANHLFTSKEWRSQVSNLILHWLAQIGVIEPAEHPVNP